MRGRFTAAAVAVVLGVAGLVTTTALPAGATSVSNEAQLRAAFGDGSETTITLTADVALTDCGAGGGDVDRDSAAALTLDGGGHTVAQTCAGERVFEQAGTGALTFSDITVTGGDLTGSAPSGGGLLAGGDVDLEGATITGNQAVGTLAHGGGVAAAGDVTVAHSTVSGNIAGVGSDEGWGGGIFADGGDIAIVGSTISGNTAKGALAFGGGFFSVSGSVSVDTSTISGNTAQGVEASFGGGGGLGPSVTVTASTFSGNSAVASIERGLGGGLGGHSVLVVNSTVDGNTASGATSLGGGIGGGAVTLVYSTITANAASGGANVAVVDGSPSQLTSFASALGLPSGGADCSLDGSTTVSNGFDFSSDASCGFTGGGDIENGGDPFLDALADNGGPTETRLPMPASPLIDEIPEANCHDDGAVDVTTDQRGEPRVGLPECDIGAVEYQPSTVGSEVELRLAFGDSSVHTISLANDITLVDCSAGEVARSSSTPVTIVGNGHTVDMDCANRIFVQHGTGTLTLSDVTVTGGGSDGEVVADQQGGGVFGAGDVVIDRSTITGVQLQFFWLNSSAVRAAGAGAYAAGDLTVTDSVISSNQVACVAPEQAESCDAYGGGLYGVGDVTVTRSTIEGNSAVALGSGGEFRASASGGGVFGEGSVTLVASTVSGNQVEQSTNTATGGGVAAESVRVVNSTVAGNSAFSTGGGLLADQITLVYATVTGNSAPAGANVAAREAQAQLTSFASVLALPAGGGGNCALGSASPIDHGFNFVDDASCGFAPTANLHFGALAANGGPTKTELPATGNPVIDAVPASSCQADGASGITADQRNFPRPAPGTGCDAGAVEVQPVDTLPGDPTTPSEPLEPLEPVVTPAPLDQLPKFTG
jgi:hypothetical protein